MPKAPNNSTPKRNHSEERLRATPFKTIPELEAETDAIRLAVWRRMEEARAINELLTKPEMGFILDQWKAGLIALYGTNGKDQVFHIYSDGRGLLLELNKVITQGFDGNESKLLEALLKAGIEGFGQLYYRGRSLIGATDSIPQDAARAIKKRKKPSN